MAGKMVIPETRQGLSASRELLPLSLLRDGLEKLRDDEVKVLTKEATNLLREMCKALPSLSITLNVGDFSPLSSWLM